MGLIVKKFGGTSVADVDCMKRVAQRVKETCEQGHGVVVVVSAMGKTTDELVKLARALHADPCDREYDMLLSSGEQISASLLAMALHDIGVEAVSMTGPQAGIRTDTAHTRAKITEIRPDRVKASLAAGKVVIICGFQGLNPNEDIATLGRGGSDLSAVALAAVLEADRCQIYTDVEGVYTADPRVVPEARKLDEVAHDEMLELASLGAKVLQSRSVEFAKKYGVVIEVLSSFTQKPGTLVKEEVEQMEEVLVRGVTADKKQAKVTVRSLEDRPGEAAALFQRIAEAGINVDMIVQNVSEDSATDLSFTVPEDDLARVEAMFEPGAVSLDRDVAKVSIVGIGMRSHTGVAFRMFRALANENINIRMISTSEIKVSVVLDRGQADAAVQVLHQAFELERPTA